MSNILNLIITKLNAHINFKFNNIIDAQYKYYERNIYREGKVFSQTDIELVFEIDTDKWFRETVHYTVSLNTYNCKLIVQKGYGCNYKEFCLKDYSKVVTFITQDLSDLAKNKTENKKMIK